jgi:hypothetical protein
MDGWISRWPCQLSSAIYSPEYSFLVTVFLLFNTFTWLVGYQVGLRLNLKKHRLPKHKKLFWHLVTLVLTPFVGIVETFGVFIAPYQLIKFDTTPTPKSSEPETENLVFSTTIEQPYPQELILQDRKT